MGGSFWRRTIENSTDTMVQYVRNSYTVPKSTKFFTFHTAPFSNFAKFKVKFQPNKQAKSRVLTNVA